MKGYVNDAMSCAARLFSAEQSRENFLFHCEFDLYNAFDVRVRNTTHSLSNSLRSFSLFLDFVFEKSRSGNASARRAGSHHSPFDVGRVGTTADIVGSGLSGEPHLFSERCHRLSRRKSVDGTDDRSRDNRQRWHRRRGRGHRRKILLQSRHRSDRRNGMGR